jgi:hypothetical protein
MLPILEPLGLQRWGTLTSLSEALFFKEMRVETREGPATAPSGAGISLMTVSDGVETHARVRLPWLTGFAIAAATIAAAAATALALSWHWIALVDLVPVLYLLPCTLMMVRCMKGMDHRQQAETAQDPRRPESPAAVRQPELARPS